MSITYFPPIPVNIKWGGISGTLTDQADLQTELDGKSDVGHKHGADDLAVEIPEEKYLKDDGSWDIPAVLPSGTNNQTLRFDSTANDWVSNGIVTIPDGSDPNDYVTVNSYFKVKDTEGNSVLQMGNQLIISPRSTGDAVRVNGRVDSTGETLRVNAYGTNAAVYGSAYENGKGGYFLSQTGVAIQGSSYGSGALLKLLQGSTMKVQVSNGGDMTIANLAGAGTRSVSADPNGKLVIGGSSLDTTLWIDLSGTRSGGGFTFPGSEKDAASIVGSLFTCLDSAGTTRRYGYIESATYVGSDTVNVDVVTSTDLASGDQAFKVTPHIKAEQFEKLVTISGEAVGDMTNPQGLWFNTKFACKLLPVDFYALTAAAGTGASCKFNVYDDGTAVFSTSQDLTTNTSLLNKRPETNKINIAAGSVVTVRVLYSAGDTNKASDLQVRLLMIPDSIFLGAA
ncbi:MAG: hypothetical protein ACLFQX_02010 [Candidatus Kapaibacterium sp.]